MKKTKSTVPDKDFLLQTYNLMLKARVLEERMIKLYKAGDSFFWIGGPGEEAWGVPLGLLVRKGRGHEFDWCHLHYRATSTLLAMGMSILDALRLTMSKGTDPSTAGRSVSGHYCFPEWNVVPVTSPIEVQYSIAIGTAWAQKRRNSEGITIITGGDAGTAEGDFESCLIWASRPGNELPMLITVQNNQWGISTSYESQFGNKKISDRGKAFGIRSMTINGNDPLEVYKTLQNEMQYIRENKKPVLIEAMVSRLYGHSSASGANLVNQEEDCLFKFEKMLVDNNFLTTKVIKSIRSEFDDECQNAIEKIRTEPDPEFSWDEVYSKNEEADWRKF